MAAVTEPETQLCGNCKKDIPVANFTIHEIHCSRNIGVCCYCSESIPKTEMKKHIESEHVQASACPLRLAVCQHCDIQLTFNKLRDHESYCGTRTETCGGCGLNIMVKDLKEHPRVCGKEVKQARVSKTVARFEHEDADLHSLRDIKNQLRSDNYTGPLWRTPRVLENRLYSSCVGDKTLKDISRRNVSAIQRNQNQEDELEELERNKNVNSSLYEEQNANLDYMLALSLQNENNPRSNSAAEIHSDFWKNYYTKEHVPSAYLNEVDKSSISCDSLESFTTSNHIKSNEIMLPCEFCEELYPAEDLILHQTGCNPASAFASFSKRRSSPNPQKYDDLPDFGSISSRSLYSSRHQAVQAEGNIMIPCEFCGIQLEEEVLFHHQDQCDLRPATANLADSLPSQQPLSSQNNTERRDSPELARRRIRHQGDVSPRCIEGFRQQRLSYPARGTRPLSNMTNARSVPLTSSGAGRASDALNLRGKPRKGAGGEGRPKNRGAIEPLSGTPPRTRPTQNFNSEAFTSCFSRTSPTRSGRGNEGGRMSDVPVSFRNRNAKAKHQSPESGYPEDK
ncbi:TRAF-type zinc finger domain-containing protein 1 isoform X2 [Rhea pennata]|uniref:TRAF-type zinc finger domain-containing protein 1 isoform X2 n=1 Tax=Rhea pennata TaxID=8795 RepID=UPI002E277102